MHVSKHVFGFLFARNAAMHVLLPRIEQVPVIC